MTITTMKTTDYVPKGFEPLDVALSDDRYVALALRDGRVMRGWMCTGTPRTYWFEETEDGARIVTPCYPVGWAPLGPKGELPCARWRA